MFKKLGIGKAILAFITFSALIGVVVGAVSIISSRSAVSSLSAVSLQGMEKLTIQNSLIKDVALVHSNVLPIPAELDKDMRMIRVDIVDGFIKESNTLFVKCGETCKKSYDDFQKYMLEWKAIVALLNKDDIKGAADGIQNKLNPLAEGMFDKLDKAATEIGKQAKTDFYSTGAQIEKMEKIRFVAIVLMVLTVISFGFIFQRKLVQTIKTVVTQVHDSVMNTADKTKEIASNTDTLSNSAQKQASAIEETVASLEEMSSMIKRNADHATAAAGLSLESTKAATSGGEEISKLIESMRDISQSSKKIEEIISVIDDIAFQTNLLALNAAVEAARAGEQGKGFAVVADAVRSLAQRSAEAAKEISELIHDSVEKTERGTIIADKSGLALQEIIKSIQKVADLNNEISLASQEQAQGIQQVSRAMTDFDQTTQTNASVASELSESTEILNSETGILQESTFELTVLLEGEKKYSEQYQHDVEEHSEAS